MQTRIGSFTESLANVAIGYCIAVVSQLVVFPWFGVRASLSQNLGIGVCFTVISIVRQYVIRRVFNARLRCSRSC